MHTKEKLTGSVCKCMDCAAARQKRVERETRYTHSEKMGEFDRREGVAVAAIEQAEADKGEVWRERRALMDEVRQGLVAAEEALA